MGTITSKKFKGKPSATTGRGTPVRRDDKSSLQAGRLDRLASGNYHGIARRSGLAVAHVSRVLRGLRGVRLETAARIAKAAEVTVDDVLTYRAMVSKRGGTVNPQEATA